MNRESSGVISATEGNEGNEGDEEKSLLRFLLSAYRR
jgi:hypothetical protein